MSEEKRKAFIEKFHKAWDENLEKPGYVKVRCRICGEPWLYPENMAKQFDSEHGFECIYCRRLR